MTEYKKDIVRIFTWFPEKIGTKTYWLKFVWVERESLLAHGKMYGCDTDIWITHYLRVVTKLERALQ